jgi:hypothetical protein
MRTVDEQSLIMKLSHFLESQPFYPCCLLVHHDVAYLNAVGEFVIKGYSWPKLSLGTLVSESLLDVQQDRRPGEAQRIVMASVQQRAPGPVLCTDIDILFEPQVALDPLRLLRDCSRLTRLVVLWPGSFLDGVLSYASAKPLHAHYRAWTKPELCQDCIIQL